MIRKETPGIAGLDPTTDAIAAATKERVEMRHRVALDQHKIRELEKHGEEMAAEISGLEASIKRRTGDTKAHAEEVAKLRSQITHISNDRDNAAADWRMALRRVEEMERTIVAMSLERTKLIERLDVANYLASKPIIIEQPMLIRLTPHQGVTSEDLRRI